MGTDCKSALSGPSSLESGGRGVEWYDLGGGIIDSIIALLAFEIGGGPNTSGTLEGRVENVNEAALDGVDAAENIRELTKNLKL